MGTAVRSRSQVADLIRSRRDHILGRWKDGVRALQHASDLDEPHLLDHLPELLDDLAAITEALEHGAAGCRAIARLAGGFDLDAVIGELAVLRDVLHAIADDPADGAVQVHDLRVLDRAIDRAIRDSVRRHEGERQRRPRPAERFLDEATKVLNSSLGYRETLEQLANLVVPDLADWCIVDLLEDERLQHVAIVHSDDSKLELAREYARNHPPDAERARGGAEVMRSGRPRIAPEITDEMLAASARDPEHLRVLRELGFKSWIGAPLTARGTTLGVLHLVMSDSDRRYSAADVDVLAELGQRAGAAVENARLYKEAQDAVRVRDDVLAIVSHDLRNPLGAIDLAAAVLLQQFGDDVRGRKHIETIRYSRDRMEHLINDLLDMASINVGKFAIRPSHLDAGEVLDEVLDIHEPIASERGVQLTREYDIRGVTLLVDRNRVIQAFANLLGNAIKFCSPGDMIGVRAQHEGDRVSFVVADTGPGIERGDLPHIFEPYWSGRPGKTTGTGLGLFIAKAIVESHGGTIDVESEDGKGATFRVSLPVAPA